MCVRRGDEWLLEERAIDGAICPPGGKIESSQALRSYIVYALLQYYYLSWSLERRMSVCDTTYTGAKRRLAPTPTGLGSNGAST